MSLKPAALAASLLLHLLAAAALLRGSDASQHGHVFGAGAVQVRLMAAQPAPQSSPPAAAPQQAVAPLPAAGEYFYFPHEVDRELIPLRDRSGDAGIVLTRRVVMTLFVDMGGRVARVGFEGEAPDALLRAQLQMAFSSMEFLPAQRGGRAVPARMTIELMPDGGPDQQPVGE